MNTEEKARRYDEALNWMREIYPGLHGATKEDAEHFFPELAESNDERIRKYLIEELKATKSVGELKFSIPGPTKEECIAYLEKQKEQKPSSKFRSGDWVVYDGPLGHAILQIEDVIDGRYTFVDNDSTLLVEDSDEFLRPLTPKDVEKPVEWSDTNELVFKDICKHLKEEGYNGWVVLLEALRNGESQPKQEWSEEDDWKRKELIQYLEEKGDYRTVWMTWLKSLPERFNLQPKQGWSEEDEKMMENIQYALRYACANSVIDEQTIEYVMTWLKSPRSRPKSSDNWKPSEEQKEALEYVIRDYREDGCNATANYLQEILDHLKNM